MWNLWKPFPAEPQVFNLFYGDKNATLLKLLSELNEMVDVKHLFSINPPPHTIHNRLRRQLPFYPVNAQFTSSHIPWKCGRNFGKPLTGDYLCLVCWSLLVMWPGRSPLTLLSSVTAHWHYSWAICLRLFSAHIPTVMHFYSHLHSIKNGLWVWGCPEQVSCQLKRSLSIPLKGTFLLSWLVLSSVLEC